ncbi:MAG TPA: YibE/F family protein [Syntrophomonadaceae bacterium]|nr:YibE/F family protein [Syntrophomonadaceae bacterium]
MLRIYCFFLVAFLAFCLFVTETVYAQDEQEVNNDSIELVRARVIESKEEEGYNFLLTLEITGGSYDGQVIKLPYVQTHPDTRIEIRPGDEVLVQLAKNRENIKAHVSEYVRDQKLLYLALTFIFILILMGGKKGIKAVISLIISGGFIFFVMLPMIFKGHDPILTTILIAAVASIISLLIIGGKNVKSLAAIIGTTGGVVIAGTLAIVAGSAMQITGFSDEEMQSLLFIPQQINYDYRGILFSGMIIGALGAVMDVGMSVASAVEEIKLANPSLGVMALIRAGMNVGRDIMGTMANTLIFAYTGGAVRLMLSFLAYNTPLIKIINLDLIATEIVRALSGSIGLIIAVPITSLAAGILYGSISRGRISRGRFS